MDSVDGNESNRMQMLNSVVCEIRNDWKSLSDEWQSNSIFSFLFSNSILKRSTVLAEWEWNKINTKCDHESMKKHLFPSKVYIFSIDSDYRAVSRQIWIYCHNINKKCESAPQCFPLNVLSAPHRTIECFVSLCLCRGLRVDCADDATPS